MYGQFLAGPERIWHFVSERARLKVKNARLYGQNLGQKLIFLDILFKKLVRAIALIFALNIAPDSSKY